MITSIHGSEAAARGVHMCFRSAGDKLVKRLSACYMEKALYKCTAVLFFTLYIVCLRGRTVPHLSAS